MKTADELVAEVLEDLDEMLEAHYDSSRVAREHYSPSSQYLDLYNRVSELREQIELETGRRIVLGPLFAAGGAR